MYKVKNITNEKILFVDKNQKETMLGPGEEIDSEYPTPYGYSKLLEIKEIKLDKPKEEVKKNGNAR